MSLTTEEVPIIGEPFGLLHEIKFYDHDLAIFEALLELTPELYLDIVHGADGVKVFPQCWVRGWRGSGS